MKSLQGILEFRYIAQNQKVNEARISRASRQHKEEIRAKPEKWRADFYKTRAQKKKRKCLNARKTGDEKGRTKRIPKESSIL